MGVQLTTCTARYFGIEKAVAEPSALRRLGYRLLGEIHIPGRIRLYHVLREIAALDMPERNVTMLDAGTGRGDLALHFARLRPGWTLKGIDIEQDRVQRCRSAARALGLANVQFELGDLTRLDERSRYDLIVNCDVLEHIRDDRSAVESLARALKPGGRLILTIPSVPQRRHLRLVAWRERRIGFTPADIGHVRPGYSPEGISRLLSEVGLEPTKIRWTYGPFGTLAHDLFFVMGDSKPNPLVFAASLPFLLTLSFLENHTPTRRGCGLLVVARKP